MLFRSTLEWLTVPLNTQNDDNTQGKVAEVYSKVSPVTFAALKSRVTDVETAVVTSEHDYNITGFVDDSAVEFTTFKTQRYYLVTLYLGSNSFTHKDFFVTANVTATFDKAGTPTEGDVVVSREQRHSANNKASFIIYIRHTDELSTLSADYLIDSWSGVLKGRGWSGVSGTLDLTATVSELPFFVSNLESQIGRAHV